MREVRHSASFSVSLMWQEKSGAVRRVGGRCLNLSSEGMGVDTRDRVDAGTVVLVLSDEFGRIGHATVRYCRRDGMKYAVGLKFSSAFALGGPIRSKILAQALKPDREGDAPAGASEGRTPGPADPAA